ncbi:MAG: hypothetical protein M1536_08555 [Firmicutes bacterium]|nr:hypothetical protein [Bacillota bacterium]
MLRETRIEKGCFAGCITFILAGALIFGTGGIFLGLKYAEKYNSPAGVMGFFGFLFGIIAGGILGGVIALIWERIKTKKEIKEEEF